MFPIDIIENARCKFDIFEQFDNEIFKVLNFLEFGKFFKHLYTNPYSTYSLLYYLICTQWTIYLVSLNDKKRLLRKSLKVILSLVFINFEDCINFFAKFMNIINQILDTLSFGIKIK